MYCYVAERCCNSHGQRSEIIRDVHLDCTWFTRNRQRYFRVSTCLHCIYSVSRKKWTPKHFALTSPWNFGSNWPRWSENADFQSIFARSASAVTLIEKSSVNTNRKSKTRFPMSLRRTSYVAPEPYKGGSKQQNGRFPCKIALRLKKVCYKVRWRR